MWFVLMKIVNIVDERSQLSLRREVEIRIFVFVCHWAFLWSSFLSICFVIFSGRFSMKNSFVDENEKSQNVLLILYSCEK